jgi:signal transduction histidine kinase
MEEQAAGPSAALSPLGRARLDDLLEELLQRVGDVLDTQDRLRGLLDAVVGIAADLSLDSVLQRIVKVACQLADARYGALGVLGSGPGRRLREFVTHGVSDEQRAQIGDLPQGHGILGVLIDKPEPLRLTSLGDHELSYGFPAHHPPMNTFLGVPLRTRDRVFGNLYLTEKQSGAGFTEEDEEIVVALAAAAGVVIENARLYEETGRRQRWLEAAADASAAMLGEGDRDEALQCVVDRVREVAAADLVAMLLSREAGRLVVEVVAGAHGEDVVGSSLPAAGATSLADLLAAGEPIVLDDIRGEARVADMAFPVEAGWPELGPMMLLPLRGAGTVAGTLVIGWSPDREEAFRETDVRLPTAFVEQTALAMQVAAAREDRALLAVFEDRDRIGRDLHDLVIQRLFAIGLTLQNAGRLAVRPEVEQRIAAAVDDLDSTIQDIRRSIFELSAPTTSTDLRAELQASIDVVVPALGFAPRLSTEGPVDSVVSLQLRPHLLAVLREALSNVARHAQASSAEVRVAVNDEVVLTVTDDGRGIAEGSRHSGLRNMRERAESLGGSFELHRAAAGGTIATWRVPVR